MKLGRNGLKTLVSSKLKSVPVRVLGAGVTIVQAVTQFLFMAIVARFYGMEFLGDINYINAIQIVLFMLFSLGLRNAMVIDYGKYNFKSFLYVRVVTSLAVFALAGAFISLTGGNLGIYVYLFLFKFVEMLSEINWAKLQAKDDHQSIFVRQAGRWLIPFLVALLAAIYGVGFNEFIVFYFISGVFCFLFFELKSMVVSVVNSKGGVVFIPVVKSYYHLSLSLFFMSVQQNIIRVLVGVYFGSAILGVFSIVYQIYSMAYMVYMNSLNFVLVKRGSYSSSVLRNILTSMVYVIALVVLWNLIGEYLFILIFGEAFNISGEVVSLVIFSLSFRLAAYVLQHDLIQRGLFFDVFKYQFLLTVCSVLMSFVLIEFYGISGGYAAIPLGGVLYLVLMVRAYSIGGIKYD